jgi:hypothetical protein
MKVIKTKVRQNDIYDFKIWTLYNKYCKFFLKWFAKELKIVLGEVVIPSN